MNQKECWSIDAGDGIYLDCVEKMSTNDINHELLPDEGYKFKGLTESVRKYISMFNKWYTNINEDEEAPK